MFFGTVIGFRHWKANPHTYGLDGPVSRVRWPAESPLEAEHKNLWHNHIPKCEPDPHESPCASCGCGLYAYHTLEDALENYGQHSLSIVGAAAFWGKIIVHTAGFKAQYGRILALSDEREREDLFWFSILEGVVEKYGIPVIPQQDLEAYALTFGGRVGAEFQLDDLE